jgi:hypothetical protein
MSNGKNILLAIFATGVIAFCLFLRRAWLFILLFAIAIFLLTKCGFPVIKNIKYTTARMSILSYPVVFTANISLGDGNYYQGEAVAYNDPKQEGPVDYVVFWYLYPRELHSIFYKKGDQWYWKIRDLEAKKVNTLSIGGKQIF